jgi:hypothetical protein
MADCTLPFTLLCVHTGFYRVNYDHTNWRLLISSFQQLPDVTRAQLLDDALNLALSGRLEYSIALDLTSQLITDVDYLPWSAAFTALEHLDTMLAFTPAYGDFKVCDMCDIGVCIQVSVLVKNWLFYWAHSLSVSFKQTEGSIFMLLMQSRTFSCVRVIQQISGQEWKCV